MQSVGNIQHSQHAPQVERVAAEEEFQARKRLATRRRASELGCASRAALDKLAESDPLEKVSTQTCAHVSMSFYVYMLSIILHT